VFAIDGLSHQRLEIRLQMKDEHPRLPVRHDFAGPGHQIGKRLPRPMQRQVITGRIAMAEGVTDEVDRLTGAVFRRPQRPIIEVIVEMEEPGGPVGGQRQRRQISAGIGECRHAWRLEHHERILRICYVRQSVSLQPRPVPLGGLIDQRIDFQRQRQRPLIQSCAQHSQPIRIRITLTVSTHLDIDLPCQAWRHNGKPRTARNCSYVLSNFDTQLLAVLPPVLLSCVMVR
jgi:hypothetical protein